MKTTYRKEIYDLEDFGYSPKDPLLIFLALEGL